MKASAPFACASKKRSRSRAREPRRSLGSGPRAVLLLVALILGAQGLLAQASGAETIAIGRYPDAASALKALDAGELDILLSSLDAARVRALPAREAERLLSVEARRSVLSIRLNAGAGATPWLSGSAGKPDFNPFGLVGARLAFGRLVDRERCLSSAGLPGEALLLPFSAGAPGAAPWYSAAFAAGYSLSGRPEAAAEFRAAMEAAAASNELAPRLRLADGAWRLDGRPLAAPVLVSAAEGEAVRALGGYLVEVLKSLGLAAELKLLEPEALETAIAAPDAGGLAWSLALQRRVSAGAPLWPDEVLGEAFLGAGRAREAVPRDAELEALFSRLATRPYALHADYERDVALAARAALASSELLPLLALDEAFVLRAAAFERVPLFDPESGFASPWFWRSLEAKGAPGGGAELRAGLIAPDPGGAPPTWRPFLPAEQRGAMEAALAAALSDGKGALPGPASGQASYLSARHIETESLRPAAGLAVPLSALVWDAEAQAWSGPGLGRRAAAMLVYEYGGAWHSGEAAKALDVLHWLAFRLDWSRRDFPEDGAFDEGLAALYPNPGSGLVAVELLPSGRLALYVDASPAGPPERLAALRFQPPGPLHWTMLEALAFLAGEGNPDGGRWALTEASGARPLDLFDPDCVAALERALTELGARGRPPRSLLGLIGPEEAAAAYARSFKFVRSRGHGLNSNGPYLLAAVPQAFAGARLLRSANYRPGNPETRRAHSQPRARIDAMDAPEALKRGQALSIELRVSALAVPDGWTAPGGADIAVMVRIHLAGRELAREARLVAPGIFKLLIQPAELSALGNGEAIIVAEASARGGPSAFSRAVCRLSP